MMTRVTKEHQYKYHLQSIANLLNVSWDGEKEYPIEEISTRVFSLLEKGHNFRAVWLTDDLEGFRCLNCGCEFVEIGFDIEPCSAKEPKKGKCLLGGL